MKMLLGDLVEVISGFAFKSEMFSSDSGVPLIRIRDVLRGYTETFYTGDFDPKYLVTKGDILVGMDGEFNSAEWTGINSLLNQRVCKIVPDETRLDRRYLLHFLPRQLKAIEDVTSFVTVKHLSVKDIRGIEVSLPSLEEQKRIAAILDKADSLRRKRAQAIALADDFLRATFLDMFGDPVTNPKELIKVRLDSICDVGSSKRVFLEELKDAGVPFYRGTEIGQLGDRRRVDPTLFIAEEHYARLKSEVGVPQMGDLLLPSICPDGRIYVVDTEEKFYFKDARVLWIKVSGSNVDSLYLRWFLKLLFASEYSKIASGTTFAELKIFALKQLKVCLPPIDVQRHFAKVVSSTERLLKRYQRGSELYDQLSQSFQHGNLD